MHHSPHGPSGAAERDKLEILLDEMVGDSLAHLHEEMGHEESDDMQAEFDEKKLLQLRMKYKYKYKYKYRSTSQAHDAAFDDNWLDQSAMQASDLAVSQQQTAKQDPEDDMVQFCIPADEVSGNAVKEYKEFMQHELDDIWRKMAAPAETGGRNLAQSRCEMDSQREKLMPASRRLKKLVCRLNELEKLCKEVAQKAQDDSRQIRGQKPLSKAAAEDEGNARVQRALDQIEETEVSSKNLLHTTSHYDLVKKLRDILGANEAPKGDNTAKEELLNPKDAIAAEQKARKLKEMESFGEEVSKKDSTEDKEVHVFRGDWNKSILVSKKKGPYRPQKITGGVGNKGTFTQFRADPWDRKRHTELYAASHHWARKD